MKSLRQATTLNFLQRTIGQMMHAYRSRPVAVGDRTSVTGIPVGVVLNKKGPLNEALYTAHLLAPRRPDLPALPLVLDASGLEGDWYRYLLMAAELRAASKAGKPVQIFGVVDRSPPEAPTLGPRGSRSPFMLYVTGVEYGPNKLHARPESVKGLESRLWPDR